MEMLAIMQLRLKTQLKELRNWHKIVIWIRTTRGGLNLLAMLVGAGAGFGAIIFRWLIVHATEIFSGSQDYSSVGRISNHHVPWLGIYFVVLAPAIGGLIYGPLVTRFAPEARGHGVPEVMYAISHRGGRIPAKVAAVKSLASAICIGAGGSVGREGPIVQIGSAIGSSLGQRFKVSENRLRTLVACGAAGGIAATFNAPIAGVFFSLELLLGEFATEGFATVVIASVTASVIGRAAFRNLPFISLPAFTISHPIQYVFYIALGVTAALIGMMFTRVLYWIEDFCDRIWRGPEWARPAVGGLFLGLILLILPEMYGVGYPILQGGLQGKYALGFLIVLMFGKMIATGFTIGIGGSGGVFAPSLFIGAMFGAAFGTVLHMITPLYSGAVGPYALVGMGAVFAGAARAPMTAIVILFELTGDYTIILPLMLAIAVATIVSRVVMNDTIYTLKLRRRGIDVSRKSNIEVLNTQTVETIMRKQPKSVEWDLNLLAAADDIFARGGEVHPVRKDGAFIGVVSAYALSRAISRDEDIDSLTVQDVLEQPPPIFASTSIVDAIGILGGNEFSAAPVLDSKEMVVGWIDQVSLLNAVSRSVTKRTTT